MGLDKRRARGSRPKREIRTRILVVAEGKETEPQYVERLDAHLRSEGTTTVVKTVGVGKDPLKVVHKCLELRDAAAGRGKEYDRCVCLVDVDQHSTLDAALSLASSESVDVIVSSLKFEVWLRWHLENKFSALTSAQLDGLLEKHQVLKDKTLAPQFPIYAVDAACQRARKADPGLASGRVGPDPSSAMPVLVDMMRA